MIQDAVDWLNENAGAIQALAVVVLVFVTYFYMRSTGAMAKSAKDQAEASVKMADEMRDQGQRAFRPILDIRKVDAPDEDSDYAMNYLDPDHMWAVVMNVGSGAALNIYVDLNGDFEWGLAGRQSLGSLGPGQRSSSEYPIKVEDESLKVEYSDLFGNSYVSSRKLEYERFEGGHDPRLGSLSVEKTS